MPEPGTPPVVRKARPRPYSQSMEATLPFISARLRALLGDIDPQGVAVWLLGFGLVVYLALEGGGYDPIVRDQLGIAIWWGVMLGLAIGALPLNRLRRGSWVALVLLAGYVGWVALSLIWTRTTAATFEDVGRVVTYLGVFVLAVSIRSSKGARRMAAALGSAIAVIAVVALLSRLHPAWFSDAAQTVESLKGDRSRLSYPLGYWNAVAALVAIGLPLVLYIACSSRHVVARALAAAALPAMALTIYFTFSRGGTLAAAIAVLAYLTLTRDRLPKLATVLLAAVGAAILIVGAHQRGALDSGLATALAHKQGDQILAMTLIVCAAVGLLQTALALYPRFGRRPAWTRPSRGRSRAIVAALIVGVLLVAAVAGAPGKASHAWHEFTAAKSVQGGSGRLGSFSSNGRWPLWKSTLKEDASAPLTGTGSGSFEGWWAEHGSGGYVKDAHSLFFETLGELGIVGLALIVGFLGWVFWSGARRYRSAAAARRDQLAAVLAGCLAFTVCAAFDWIWEIAVIPIAFLLLASVLVSAGDRRREAGLPWWARVAAVPVALAAMVAIAIPLSAASSLQQSQAAARGGDYAQALGDARDAQQVEPFAAAYPLQEALVLERLGRLGAAEASALTATRREPRDWRSWVVLSRLQAERGRAQASLTSYRRAKELNPHSLLFKTP
jgi:O-Antigen ligase